MDKPNCCNFAFQILVVGAGGLGCELLKSLSLMGFLNMHVIDMDTIDLSNLNRQFLFRQSDIDKPKAEVAASFINKRIPGAQVQISLIDGGTEGFKGNARIIMPGKSACIGYTLNLYPPQVNFLLCTIAQTPRLPEHCIEYVRMMQWPAETPFGKDIDVDNSEHIQWIFEKVLERGSQYGVRFSPAEMLFHLGIWDAAMLIDGDNPEQIQWIFEKALERGSQYGISGITYRLTQGAVKNIIPAVASTNAVIAAAYATEVFKLLSGCAPIMNNYMVYTYAYTFEKEKKKDCMACSLESQIITLREESTLRELIDFLIESPVYQMKSPGVTMVTAEGRNKSLYMKALREHTEDNLSNSKVHLGNIDGTQRKVCMACSLESQIITLREEITLRELIDFLIESPVYQMRIPGFTMVTVEGRNKTLYMEALREHTEANLSKEHDYDLVGDVNSQEIKSIFKNLKGGTAAGVDGIPILLFKNFLSILIPIIVLLCNKVLRSGQWPSAWKTSLFIPLFKRGDLKAHGNYRLIALVPALSKVLEKILDTRLSNWLNKNNLMHEEQGGFRTGYETTDSVFILKALIDKYGKDKTCLYVGFLDLHKAFDSVDRELLKDDMLNIGLPHSFVRLIVSMYTCVNDIALVANKPQDLQTLLNLIEDYLHIKKLRLNTEKS
ncbi:hypothetical protein QYM36_008304 [Artemia franciscana]|uniref:NEDD8-activating enzyme E1 catalytic subunit n=1 Tax=Artemia franciscana TaxID=6661 RepID=A0AA88LDS7_ARTSF|nr:hypothetical protein QYM36_008304 [Artemia franciscana]